MYKVTVKDETSHHFVTVKEVFLIAIDEKGKAITLVDGSQELMEIVNRKY